MKRAADPIARIAAKLTRAQYEVMTSKMYRWEVAAVKSTARVLMRLELIAPGKDHELFETYVFTSQGKKVRAFLLGEKYDQPIETWNWETDSKDNQ